MRTRISVQGQDVNRSNGGAFIRNHPDACDCRRPALYSQLMFPVSPAKAQDLAERMARLGINEADLDESFVRSGGRGGQNVNKVATCVVLVHRPTGIMVKCQRERSQAMNRFLARRLLADKLERRVRGERSAEAERIARIRRQKRRRSKRAQEKMLAEKHERSATKALRRKVTPERDA